VNKRTQGRSVSHVTVSTNLTLGRSQKSRDPAKGASTQKYQCVEENYPLSGLTRYWFFGKRKTIARDKKTKK